MNHIVKYLLDTTFIGQTSGLLHAGAHMTFTFNSHNIVNMSEGLTTPSRDS